jgi:hypothetical protein
MATNAISSSRFFLLVCVILAICYQIYNSFYFAGLSEDYSAVIAPSFREFVNGYEQTGANSGAVFVGSPYRSYDGKRVFRDGKQEASSRSLDKEQLFKRLSPHHDRKTTCTKWSVVTTIFYPSDAIIRAAELGDDWCLVIVGDNKTPTDYMDKAEGNALKQSNVFFFTAEEQKKWIEMDGKISGLVNLTPENHFGRKNLGFLYAVVREAKFIFDFDDDNFVNKDASGKLVSLIPNESQAENVRFVTTNMLVFNHHDLMGATADESWPRGFPLGAILEKENRGTVVSKGNIDMSHIGVIQFCADENPDIDAIHRFVKPLPMSFAKDSYPVLVPAGAFSPYNAQATVHTASAFFAMPLPVTVKGRVSDIWRSYFSQALFRDLNLRVLFAPPSVVQIRNAHNYYGDMESERDLYLKGKKLVEFLSEWTSIATSIPERMEQLWIDLFERGYIELLDVEMVQFWLGALVESGYSFPTASEPLTTPGGVTAPARKASGEAPKIEVGNVVDRDEQYLCLKGTFADNCNKILSIARAKRRAVQLGLKFALVNQDDYDWYDSLFDRHPDIVLPDPDEHLNCTHNITGKQAYYNDYKNERQGNPFIPELAKYLMPRADLRKKAEKAVRDTYGDKAFMSVHRRSHKRCPWRATNGPFGRNVGGGMSCSKQIMLDMCDLKYDTVQEKYNPTNLPVVLFTDGRNQTLDETFPTIDKQDFFTQLWMMTLSERHVGIPVSTVDLVVNHWRFAQGKRFIEPAGCYNPFQEDYVLDPRHFEIK